MLIHSTYTSHKFGVKTLQLNLHNTFDTKFDAIDMEQARAFISLLGGYNPLFNKDFEMTQEQKNLFEEYKDEFQALINRTNDLLIKLQPRTID